MYIKPEICAVAVDLDDTLLRRDKTISERTLDAWERCRAKGIKLIVATARASWASADYIQQLRPDAAVYNAGGLVCIGERLIISHTFEPETANGIVRTCLEAESGTITAETVDGYYWNAQEPLSNAKYANAVYTDFREPLPPTYKLTVEIENEALAQDIASRFPGCVLVSYYGEYWRRFSPSGVTKMTGLLEALTVLGLSPKQVAAFGDDYGDIEMLAGVGWGVAMDNAAPEVRSAAKEITDDNEHDGVARWLEHRVFCPVSVRPAAPEETELLHSIQRRAFLPLLEKYQDYELSPASESLKGYSAKLTRPGTTGYLICYDGEPVGSVRIIAREDSCKVSALGISPEYQNRGIALWVMRQMELMYPEARVWVLDTILQEARNCHLYERLGYVRVGAPEAVNERMTLVSYRKER